MQPNEKFKVMRLCKGWSQEEMAEKLNWAINSYRKIEQGKAGIKLEQLKQIADVMEIDMEELINSDDKTVFNFAENHSNLAHSQNNCTIYLTEAQCVHELEKAKFIIESQKNEIENLKVQITQLQKINALLEKNQ